MALSQHNRDYIKKQIPAEWAKLEKRLKEKQNISMENFFDDEGNERIIGIVQRKVKNFKL